MGSATSDDVSWPPHVVLFPFMSKGHTIPLLYLARLLLRRDVAVTVVTTPSNHPFIAQSLQASAASIIDLPFPENLPDVPAGVESLDKLPSISDLFFNFAVATQPMQPHFECLLHSVPRVSFMVSDGFLWWTLDSAAKLGIPRFVFYGMSNYSHAVSREAFSAGILSGPHPHDELVSLTGFPWIRLSKDDLESIFLGSHTKSTEFLMKARSATANSYGMIVNSFYELEPLFVDYLNTESSPKTWCVGPLCLAEHTRKKVHSKQPSWIHWLDQKLEEKCCVLYVAFGSQAEVSAEQFREIAIGLEETKVHFLWVIRKNEWKLPEVFEERVKARGTIVREWVDQTEILMHESVQGFLSHCGWNSVLESVCAGVPILAFPMMAEQPLNARMVEEEIKVGLRVEKWSGSVKGLVRREELEKRVRELMEGEGGKEARKKAKELAEKAVEEGGSSWRTLETLIYETCRKETNTRQE